MSKYALALSRLASPLAFGGPGSGRRPGGGGATPAQHESADNLSAAAHEAQMEKHVAQAKEKQFRKIAASLISPLALVQNPNTSQQVTNHIVDVNEMPALSLLQFASLDVYPVQPGPASGGDASKQQTAIQPCFRFAKDVLATGSFQHPVQKWKLDVDEKYMDKLCAAFDAMKQDGMKVPIYADHKPSATTHLGYLSGLCRGGPEALKKYPEMAKLPADKAPLNPKKLYAIHDFNDEKAAALASGVGQVSVLIDKNMKGGTGKAYGPAVRHVAITPEPVVAGQDGFCKLSLDGEKVIEAAWFKYCAA